MLGRRERAGLVWREPASRGYTPGPRLAALGRDVMLNGSLRAERHSILARLVEVIGETCNFTMLDGAEVVYLDRVEAAWPLRVTLSPGSHVPLHCTASGKLLLALLPKAARTRLLAHLALSRHTDTTITDGKRLAARPGAIPARPLPRNTDTTTPDGKRLAAELAQIRASRFATDNEEYHAGLVCVAVPVMDARRRACAAIAVQALASRMPLRRALEHLPVLRSAADAMAATVAERPAQANRIPPPP